MTQFINNTVSASTASSGSYTPVISNINPPGSFSSPIVVSVPFTWTKIDNTVDIYGALVIPTETVTVPPPSSQTLPPVLYEFDLTLPFIATLAFGTGNFYDASGAPPDYPPPQFRFCQVRLVSPTAVRIVLQGPIPHDGGLFLQFRMIA